jgi:Tfp pilus assembly protein FimV
LTPFDVAFVKSAVSVVIVAATTYAFYGLRLRYRAAGRQALAEAEDRHLADGERAALEARVAELEERLDFAERRLAQESDDRARLHRPIATPV